MALQPIGRPKFAGETAPAIIVSATIALPVVGVGFLVDNLLSSGEIRSSSLMIAFFLLWNLVLCFLWSRIKSTIIMSRLLVGTLPLQWGWIGALACSVFFRDHFESADGIFFGLFVLFAAATFIVARSSLKKPLNDSGFLTLSVAIMAAMIWHGIYNWSMPGNIAFSRGVLSAKSIFNLQSNSGVNSEFSRHDAPNFKGGRQSKMPWAYSGEAGPDMWSALAEENRTCSAGHEQSPVDIPARTPLLRDNILLSWMPEQGAIVNDGRIMKVNLAGKSQATIAGKKYSLKSIHVHTPSEHQVSGFGYPMEVQFIHESATGGIAIIAAFVEIGANNPDVASIISLMPVVANGPAVEAPLLNMMSLMPSKLDVYRYKGSLTTPPCSEHVLWSIVEKPIQFSQDQITAFRKLLPSNARSIQTMGARSFESTESGIAH